MNVKATFGWVTRRPQSGTHPGGRQWSARVLTSRSGRNGRLSFNLMFDRRSMLEQLGLAPIS